jgi:hypothetical protein
MPMMNRPMVMGIRDAELQGNIQNPLAVVKAFTDLLVIFTSMILVGIIFTVTELAPPVSGKVFQG